MYLVNNYYISQHVYLLYVICYSFRFVDIKKQLLEHKYFFNSSSKYISPCFSAT